MKLSNNVENKTCSETNWRVQLVCEKVQAHSSLEPQSGTDLFDESRFVMTFLNILGVTEILCSFRLVLEGKMGKEMPESSGLEFLEKFSANSFALLDAEDNTSKLLNRGDIYIRFTFVESTIGNLPKFPRAKFLGSDGLFCFISICKFGSFKNPFVTITSLSELYFRLKRFILLVKRKKSDFYELWQLHKQLKTLEMGEFWPDTYDEGYIHQFQLEPIHSIH